MVGIAATILYAALVTPFIETARCHPIQPSLGAYAAATLYSYLAYRSLTFVSGPSHLTEAPRFPAILDALR
ncbi:GtrA family protein [Mesorhizobium sp.]|uniref:GtrA family protein n=1 Tax=Mesorhizobium sp. TaxID=1871066 RepID=UPI0034206506